MRLRHLTKPQAERFYEQALQQIEAQCLQAHINALTGAEDAETELLAAQTALVSVERDQQETLRQFEEERVDDSAVAKAHRSNSKARAR